jgi:16S rRNA (guanine527-N7)-methyltransferase
VFHVKRPTEVAVPAPEISNETAERLELYAGLLLRWNARINLISRRDETRIMDRHVADALQLVPLIPAHTARAIDIGSGGGLPGLVLAIATGIPFDLIESDKRKAAFLREAARETAAPATVHAVRIEDAGLAPAPLITARALAPVARILDLAAHLLTPNGVFLLPKGRNADQELTDAKRKWNMRVEAFPSRTDPGGTLLRLSEVARA